MIRRTGELGRNKLFPIADGFSRLLVLDIYDGSVNAERLALLQSGTQLGHVRLFSDREPNANRYLIISLQCPDSI